MKKETRIWTALLLFGLLGQLAWTIENMYFNVFVYNTLSGSVDTIAAMVALSAITATLTTLLMGALSDRLGKRKIFITLGYLLWGLSVIAFAFLNLENVSALFPAVNAVSFSGILAVVMDCIMTFFGSTANDACFNAWITDTVEPHKRGKYETVLAVLPLASMLIVFGLLDGLTQQGRWDLFFIIIGTLVSLCGIFGWFIIRDEKAVSTGVQSLKESLLSGFSRQAITANPALYLSLLCLLVFSISTQIFMPYMIIYIQAYLGINNYALILGVVLISASVVSILAGRLIDKVGSSIFFLPSIILQVIGLLMMYRSRRVLTVIIAGIIMMSGSLIVTALINGSIRDHTPKDRAGSYQGIRMIFGVMLPMIIGPYIGAFVIKSSHTTYEDLGVIKQVPNENIWLAAAIVAGLLIIPYLLLSKTVRKLNDRHTDLLTEYGEKLDEQQVLQDYPRPQFVRDSYLNLNGLWQYAINQEDHIPDEWQGTILVPYPLESLLSKVSGSLNEKQTLWYRRTFRLPEDFNRGLVWLNFGAVDQSCTVYVNGRIAGSHQGGYFPFSLEISQYLQPENELIVAVKDPTEKGHLARGKQTTRRGGIWYTPVSGIWQTVWLESTPKTYIASLKMDVDYDRQDLHLQINGNAGQYHLIIKEENHIICDQTVNDRFTFHLEQMHSWSPEDPFLYDLQIETEEDCVSSYFAMRKFSCGADQNGIMRLMLNNHPYFHKGVLDQGYYSDGIYTPASYQQIEDDIRMLKSMGFNTIRKHIKIEPLIFYHYCDKLGMLVWQDMVNGGGNYNFLTIAALPFVGISLPDNLYPLFGRTSKKSRQSYIAEMQETVELLYNCPCIALWVPFNEGWGQFDSLKITEMIRQMDGSRLIDHASGWHDQKGGDLCSKHIYFNDIKVNPDPRVWALTEYGGYNMAIEGHVYNNANYGYLRFATKLDLQTGFLSLHSQQIDPQVEKGLSALIYTQLSDVEDEVNGLVTYDRKVVKYDPDFVRRIMDKYHF